MTFKFNHISIGRVCLCVFSCGIQVNAEKQIKYLSVGIVVWINKTKKDERLTHDALESVKNVKRSLNCNI